MNRFGVVFFDLFFTLISPEYLGAHDEYDVLGLTREEWEDKAEEREFLHLRSVGAVSDPLAIITEMARKTGVPHGRAEAEEILRRRDARIRRCIVNVRQDILDVLAELRRRGIKLCVVSNADAVDILRWSESPLRHAVDDVIFSCDVGCVKPDAEIYRLALKRMGAEPENCVFVGDGGSEELRGAKEAGMATVLTEHFRVWKERENRLRYADYRVDNFHDLLEILSA